MVTSPKMSVPENGYCLVYPAVNSDDEVDFQELNDLKTLRILS